MVGCPGCGSKLVFDIASQQMKCGYCGQFYLVNQVSKRGKNADEHKDVSADTTDGPDLDALISEEDRGMEVTCFTCSQCGAEIVADSDEAVTWCSYCGSPATLKSRLTRIRRPDRVIPFKITKEDCTRRYRELARKQIYAPSALLKKGKTDSFRGIYMPFWTYAFKREGTYRFPGRTDVTVGNERITTNYMADGTLKSNYSGLSHDASLSFDDEVSEHIIPFNQNDALPFDECYLNGFYANAADQGEAEYQRKMLSMEGDLIIDIAKNELSHIGLKEKEAKDQLSDASAYQVETESKLDMFPVWFLSYKQGDRVSYGTVNGQNGKIYADFPASPVKYLLFSLLTAIPVFLFLNLVLTATPAFVLLAAVLAAMVVSGMYKQEVEEIYRKQCHVAYDKKKMSLKKFGSAIGTGFIFLIGICFYGGAPVVIGIFSGLSQVMGQQAVFIIIGIIALVLFVIRFFKMKDRYMALSGLRINLPNILFIAVSAVSLVIFIVNPPSDMIFYALAFAIAGIVACTVTELIRGYNILSSTKPKQFNRSGGDDNA